MRRSTRTSSAGGQLQRIAIARAIAHDLRVVVRLAGRLAVMDAGRITSPVDLDRPPHVPTDPALRRLVDAVPVPPACFAH
jgi:ABC-type dipeptide/oligopeptide/nickel transport system ATPase subunit